MTREQFERVVQRAIRAHVQENDGAFRECLALISDEDVSPDWREEFVNRVTRAEWPQDAESREVRSLPEQRASA